MVRINIKAVVLGFLATIALDAVVSVVLLAVFGGDIFAEGRSDQEFKDAIRATTTTVPYLVFSFILGSMTTVIGAYLAARIAKRYPYFNALGLGLLGVAWELLFWSDLPLWLNLLGIVLAVPTALVGAWVYVRLSRKE